MGLSLSVLIATIGLLATLRSWLHQKQKDRIDDCYLQLDAILERLEPNDLDQDTLFEIHEELSSLRRCAVRQLSQEKFFPTNHFEFPKAFYRTVRTGSAVCKKTDFQISNSKLIQRCFTQAGAKSVSASAIVCSLFPPSILASSSTRFLPLIGTRPELVTPLLTVFVTR